MTEQQPIFFDEEAKEKSEYVYWWRRWKAEKKLANGHYEKFYTTYFGLNKEFYVGKKIMDVGCGPRGSLEWAAGIASAAIGVDPLVNEYTRFGISNHSMVYIDAGAEKIPVPTASLDCVFAFNSIDHVTDVDACIEEIKRILKPGGIFLFMVEINHEPTVQEPHTLSASIIDKFGFDVVDLRTYRQIKNEGCYSAISDEKNRAEDDGVSDMWLTAKMVKPA